MKNCSIRRVDAENRWGSSANSRGTPCRRRRERRSQLSTDQTAPHCEKHNRNNKCEAMTEYLFIVPMMSSMLRYT